MIGNPAFSEMIFITLFITFLKFTKKETRLFEMQLPVFFEENLPEGAEDFELTTETSKHIGQVLRMKSGEQLILTNGKGIEMHVKIMTADKKQTIVSFIEKRNLLAPDNMNGIALSLLKNESRFEWFAEKATEMGIHKIFPLIANRTEKKTFRMERIKNVMISAMIQSRQYFLPELSAPVTLPEIFSLNEFHQKLIAHCIEDQDKAELNTVLEKDSSKLILIGPEGDFTEEEISLCLKEGFLPVGLGKTRLRTETAGIMAAVYLTNV